VNGTVYPNCADVPLRIYSLNHYKHLIISYQSGGGIDFRLLLGKMKPTVLSKADSRWRCNKIFTLY